MDLKSVADEAGAVEPEPEVHVVDDPEAGAEVTTVADEAGAGEGVGVEWVDCEGVEGKVGGREGDVLE